MKTELKLSKRIPARTKTIRFRWAYKNFLQCTEKYKKIRGNLRGRRKASMTYCDWCKYEFEIDEWFGIAQPVLNQEGPKRNWALCHSCADLMNAPSRPKVNNQKG